MNETLNTLLQTAASALLLDIDQIRRMIAAAREGIGAADNDTTRRILSDLQMAEGVLDATETYADKLIVLSREHRRMLCRTFH